MLPCFGHFYGEKGPWKGKIKAFTVFHKAATRCRSFTVFPTNITSFLLTGVYKLLELRHKNPRTGSCILGVKQMRTSPRFSTPGETFLMGGLVSSSLQPDAWKVTFCKVPVVVERMQFFFLSFFPLMPPAKPRRGNEGLVQLLVMTCTSQTASVQIIKERGIKKKILKMTYLTFRALFPVLTL